MELNNKGIKMKKRTLKKYLKDHKESVLHLGCGRTNLEKYFGLDIEGYDGVDMVADAEEVLPIPDNTFDHAYAQDFLEHLVPQKSIHIMEEIYRVLKPGGKFQFTVPSTDGNNIAAFQDPTHYSFWNEMKFRYFLGEESGISFRPIYDIKCHFKVLKLETYFNEWNITYVRGVLQKPELTKQGELS